VGEVLLDEPALVVEARPQALKSSDRIGENAARTPQDVERSARASEQMLVGADMLDATRQSSDSFDHAQGKAAVVRTAGAMSGALDERPPQSRRIGGQLDRRRVLRRELTTEAIMTHLVVDAKTIQMTSFLGLWVVWS